MECHGVSARIGWSEREVKKKKEYGGTTGVCAVRIKDEFLIIKI